MSKQVLAAQGDLDAGGMTLRDMLWGHPAIYHTPLFQRPYVWGKRQFDQLWRDVDAVVDGVVKTRFLGALVLENISSGLPGRPSEYLIVDGQQRLTTLFLMLTALAELSAELPDHGTLVEDIVDSGLLNTVPTAKGVPKLAPTLKDRAQFHAVASRLASLTKLSVLPPSPYGEQSGLMAKMYDRVREKIEAESQLFAAEAAQSAIADAAPNTAGSEHDEGVAQVGNDSVRKEYFESLYGVLLDRLKFVGISLGADDDPHQVFDRLNNAGIKLGVSDLVRNDVFSRLSTDPDAAKALSEGPWAAFEKVLGTKFDDFAFAYGLIWKPSSTKGSLLGDLRDHWGAKDGNAPWTAKAILEDMDRFVPPFLAVASPADVDTTRSDWPSLSTGLDRQTRRLRQMPIPTSVYPYAVMVVKAVLDESLKSEDAERALLLIESFLVRRGFAGLEPTGLHVVFKSMWQDTGGKPAKLIAALERRATIRFPTDLEFEDHIRSRSVFGMRLLPHVLREYDASLPGDDVPIGTLLTVDHVMPQKLGPGWTVSKGDHERLLNTWANLVPLSAKGNASKSNQTWQKVHDRLQTETMWKTTKRLAHDYATWGPTQIAERADSLVTWAMDRWPRNP